MDYTAFRSASARGEAVSVNHKALITRALTKYPVDYALFRELLQNSADAQATSATIQFQTSQPTHKVSQLHGVPVTRLNFSNNGLDFDTQDWNRLREIASGNPNEAKIGAFGVGFYSVFELTDEPLVHSGHKIMNFRYEGVQLHYFFTESASSYQNGTLIDIPYKNVDKLPDLVKFVGFLVQSFLLINLENVNLELKYGNGEVISLLSLNKAHQSPTAMSLPPGLRTISANRTLKLAAINKTEMTVTLRYLNMTQTPPLTLTKGFFSLGRQLVSALVTDSGDPAGYTEMKCQLTKVDCLADVSVSSSFRKQMIETLLKPPPKQAVLALVSFSEADQAKEIGPLKSYVIPEEYNDAKIFIGFPTRQSTGIRSHLALNQLIPTMERTVVDMSNSFVKDWNSEMLFMAGIMARCAYEHELKNLAVSNDTSSDPEKISDVLSRYSFGTSAPDKFIGVCVKTGFWESSQQTLVPSSKGILPNNQVRLPGSAAPFLRNTPVVLDSRVADELSALDMLHEISYDEIVRDIISKPLSSDLAVHYVHWLVNLQGNLSEMDRVKLLSALKLVVGNDVYDFNDVKFYLDRSKLPDEEVATNLPSNCLPSKLGTLLGHKELQSLGVLALDVTTWVNFRFQTLRFSEKIDSSSSQSRYAKVLQVMSNSWSRLPTNTRKHLQTILRKQRCVPTQLGLQTPTQAYIREFKLFPELPVVSPSSDLLESWLLEIGVRASMDMALVLEALNDSKLKWTNEDLLQYLEDNRQALTASDWRVLQDGRFFTGKNINGLSQARNFYPPNRYLERLGLPTIAMKYWDNDSVFARILFHIGLRKFPNLNVLFTSLDNPSKYEYALSYYLENYDTAKYSPTHIQNLPVIPVEGSDDHVLPRECFYDAEISALGLPILKQSYINSAAKLGVRRSPPISYSLNLVLQNYKQLLSLPGHCEEIFTYFAKHAGELSESDFRNCKDTPFIPFRRGNLTEWHKPRDIYLPCYDSETKEDDTLRPLLKTINPSRQSLPFYHALGISDRPSIAQLAEKVLLHPAAVLDLCPAVDNYEAILCEFDKRWNNICSHPQLLKLMNTSPFLLGEKRFNNDRGKENLEVSLYTTKDLVIIDDVVAYNRFKEQIVTCPQNDTLEHLYLRLGVSKLSEIVHESVVVGKVINDEEQKTNLEKRINERLELHRENSAKSMKNFGRIRVTLVNGIELHHQLPSRVKLRLKTTACCDPNNVNVLFVAPVPSYDWIDIANALAKMVLVKPNQDSVVVLEVQLSSNLNILEKKGYNVQKLRKSQEIRRLARVKPLVKDISNDISSVEAPKAPLVSAVDPSTESGHQISGRLTNNIGTEQPTVKSKALASSPKPSHSHPSTPPPSYSPAPYNTQSAKLQSDRSHSSSAQDSPFGNLKRTLFGGLGQLVSPHTAKSAHNPLTTNNPASLQQDIISAPETPCHTTSGELNNTLSRGLKSAREFEQGTLDPVINEDPALPIDLPQCSNPVIAQSLQYYSTLHNGIKVFTCRSGNNSPVQDEIVLSEAILLLCEVFEYSPKAVSIYRESDTNTLAFNFGGSIFFNSCKPVIIPSILDYYYPIMAHELAHNLVKAHGANHSFYSESYVQQTLKRYRQITTNYGIDK